MRTASHSRRSRHHAAIPRSVDRFTHESEASGPISKIAFESKALRDLEA
jgi:hypothetical protein